MHEPRNAKEQIEKAFLDLLEEKEKEIARLKFKLQENQYE